MSQNGTFLLVTTTWVFLFGFAPDTWSQEKAEDWFLKGNVLSRQGRFEEAVDAYKKSIEHNPNATVAHFNLALVYKNLNKDYRKIYYPAWWAVIAIIIKILPFFLIRYIYKFL